VSTDQPTLSVRIAHWGRNAGLAIAMFLWLSPLWGWQLDPERPQLNAMAGIAALMAVWWMTEAIPMAATALVPLALFPLFGIMPGNEIAAAYGHRLIFLFLGGFLIALAIEESGLHRRIALTIVAAVGDDPRRVILGFMLATGFLSMWISNTATTLMMLPIAGSILVQAESRGISDKQRHNFSTALMLAIAYSASIGGMATLIGTPPNIAFKGLYESAYPDEPTIGFFNWMVMTVPFSLCLIGIVWIALCRWIFPVARKSFLGGRDTIRDELSQLGRMTAAECRMAVIFGLTALLWVCREPVAGIGWAPVFGKFTGIDPNWLGDETSAIFMATICFVMPSGKAPGGRLLEWKATERLPWGLLFLFGGGIALAAGMGAAGLDVYLGQSLAQMLGPLPDAGRVGLLAFGMTWLTELTSNLASVNMIIPVLDKAAVELGTSPLLLMIPTTLAASCAFMLPVATPPNAIVYGSGRVRIGDMIKAGLWFNLVGIVLVTVTVLLLGPIAFGTAAMSGG